MGTAASRQAGCLVGSEGSPAHSEELVGGADADGTAKPDGGVALRLSEGNRLGASGELDPPVSQSFDVAIVRHNITPLQGGPLATFEDQHRTPKSVCDPIVGQQRGCDTEGEDHTGDGRRTEMVFHGVHG